MNTSFYTYLHTRNDTGTVFYVGKGRGKRAGIRRGRNPYWRNIVAKHGHTIVIVDEGLDEATAFELERFMVAFCGRETLANCTDGGEGSSGYIPTGETLAKMSIASTGRRHSPETRIKIGTAAKGHVVSAGQRAQISATQKGHIVSAETLTRMSIASTGRVHGSEARAKIGAASRSHVKSAETRAKLSVAQRGHAISEATRAKLSNPSAETLAKISTASRAMWARRKESGRAINAEVVV